MFNQEEEKLAEYKNLVGSMPVPINSLDAAIFAGFQKAKAEEKRKTGKRRWIFSLAAAAIVLVGFFSSIRLSQVFASYVSVIPGMEKVVELIQLDKGRMSAIEEDYYEKIGVSDKKGEVKFTIDGAIADESGLILFYTMDADKNKKELTIDDQELKSLDGQQFDMASASFGSPHYSEKGEKTFSGTIDYFFEKPLKTRKFELSVEIEGNTHQLEFELKEKLYSKKTYKMNKTISIQGQKITFLNAEVYPLRASVHLKMDPKNTKKLLDFADLKLVDEHGETWGQINNGASGSSISDDERIIYLQSNYFKKPKELYLVFNKIQAVDKDEAAVVVNPFKEQILKQPTGNKIKNLRIEGNDLIFTMPFTEGRQFFNFGKITDGDGREVETHSSFSRTQEDKKINEIGINIKNLSQYKAPFELEIAYFPSWIEGKEKIRIK